MIGARDWADHITYIVLQRIEDFGITPKCEFGKRELEFYGYRFSENGLMPYPGQSQSNQRDDVRYTK